MAIENWPETGRIPVYLVGGAVRDRLLGRTPREYDFAFDADEVRVSGRDAEEGDVVVVGAVDSRHQGMPFRKKR